MPAPTCKFCGGPINAQRDYKRIRGWEKRGGSGGSDIYLREPFQPTIWACWECIGRMKSGLSVEQESLL